RKKNNGKISVFEGLRVHLGQERAQCVPDALEQKESVVLEPTNVLNRPVAWGKKLRHGRRNRAELGLDAAREKGVERWISPQRLFRFFLINARRIFLTERAAVD